MARVKKRHIEDQDVHLLLSRQDELLFLNFFVIASKAVYARDAELVARA